MIGIQALRIFFLLCLAPALSPAVKINAKGREIIYLAKGESVKLGCPFELEPQDDGPNDLDIEWTQMNADPTNLDNVCCSLLPAHQILSYQAQQVIHPGYPYLHPRGGSGNQDAGRFSNPGFQQSEGGQRFGSGNDCCNGLQQRVNFAAPDPSKYDASINLQNVQISDSATYECKVKKTSVATRKVTVKVLEKPSIPHCSISGKVFLGNEITLRCDSQTGTPPLMYRWAKMADYPIESGLPANTMAGSSPGDLVIHKVSPNHLGVYQCVVSNKVGSARCTLEVSHDSPLLTIIVGAVLGSLLFLVLLICLIVCLVRCCKKKKRKEGSKKESNQIRVDTAAPRPRPDSRNSSLRSVLGYIPHNINFMQRRKYESPRDQEGVEMVSANQDPELSLNSCTSPPTSGHPSVVTTKARVHYDLSGPSYSHGKSSASASSNPPCHESPNSDSPTCERDAAHGKRSHPGQFGGVPVMMQAKTREGLVI
ncbi:V-set and immunoglobulin domain-containing protein 8 isoform X2 [Pantherophis guttatus]|uniref:V-set and immunoglobulin domain-containing protein 8 isoform X2 n=1 Tax=Pantherophis guttatus TaxID=94885 RepID=UPI0014834A59|nr:V-set and immunoglobulin domain-containing protein 8 isoform X2 [Pantherophis guttatus]